MAEQRYDYIIGGAGLAGASAVEGIREQDTRGTILLAGADPQRPYNRPPLSKGLWTGKEKLDTIRSYVRREMSLKYGADAFLHPRIQVVGAKVEGFNAFWDGTMDSIIYKDWHEVYQGVTSALSLAIIVEDANGVKLYINRGGIQVASKIYRGKFVSVPASELLADEGRNMGAVYIALKDLVEKPSSTK